MPILQLAQLVKIVPTPLTLGTVSPSQFTQADDLLLVLIIPNRNSYWFLGCHSFVKIISLNKMFTVPLTWFTKKTRLIQLLRWPEIKEEDKLACLEKWDFVGDLLVHSAILSAAVCVSPTRVTDRTVLSGTGRHFVSINKYVFSNRNQKSDNNALPFLSGIFR